ncbi:PspC domain-containing protein [Heyndrickxia sp. NPDC080065]|uniref:PspC domain-containing protein n=1 Tax=Heyndrickxia sp. NPDC080065 TaxID=3390568 RepID=UPI003D01A876
MSDKRLSKSTTDKKVCGVLAGIAKYFNVDPTLIRLGFIVLALATAIFPCLIGYFLAYLVLPDDTDV